MGIRIEGAVSPNSQPLSMRGVWDKVKLYDTALPAPEVLRLAGK